MALIPLRKNLFDKLVGVYLTRRVTGEGRVSTTLDANVAAAGVTLTLDATTGTAAGKILLVGSGEEAEALVQSGAAAGDDVTVYLGAKHAHVAGETVAEGVAYDLGEIASVSLLDTAERADNESDISRSPYGTRLGWLSYGLAARLPSLDPRHLAFALGIPLARVTGANSLAEPTQLFTDGDDLGREPTYVVVAAIDDEGNLVYQELGACDADYTQVQVPLSQGPETGLNLRLVARAHPRVVKGALHFAPDASLRIGRQHYPEALLDAGYFEVDSGGVDTTLTAATTVDGTTAAVTSATGIAGGVWLLISGGGRSQIVWVQSVASLTATLRTKTAYVFPAGSKVIGLKLTRAGGLREGGTQFTVGGTVKQVRFDNARVQSGVRAGRARFALGFAPTSFTLETLRRRLGLPAAAISSNVLTVSDLVGTDAPVGTYARVQRKDGQLEWIILNSVDNTIAQLEMALGMADMWAVPLEHVGQQVQVLQYAPA